MLLVRKTLVSSLVLLLAAGCAGTESEPPSTNEPAVDEPLGETSEAITANEVMTRAQEWVDLEVPYCGGVNGGTDYICGGTCERPSAPWDDFRTDCSGFVSWCWQISSDPTTDTYMNDHSGDNGWHTISIDDLATGDAVVCDGHIKLWNDFASDSSADIFEEYNCGHVARHTVQNFTRNGNTMKFSGDSRVYHPIRRNNIVPLATVDGYLDSADVMVKGWAADMNASDVALDVDLYFGGDAGDGLGVSLVANESRPDIASALGIDPNHGYSVLTPFYYCDGKSHQVFAYGHTVDDGTAVQLAQSPRDFTCPIGKSPEGVIRHVVSEDSLASWKFDVRSELAWMTPEDHATHTETTDWPTAPIIGKTIDGAVWVVDGNERRHVVNPDSLAAWAFDASTIVAWSDSDAAKYSEGKDLPPAPILLKEVGKPSVYVLDAPVDPSGGPPPSSGNGTASGGNGANSGSGGGDGIPTDHGGCSIGSSGGSSGGSSHWAYSSVGLALGLASMFRRRARS